MFELNFCFPQANLRNVDTPYGRYYVLPDGRKFPSVTTILGFSKEFDTSSLEAWRERVGKDAAQAASIQGKRRGSAIHKLAEGYLLGDPAWQMGAMPFNIEQFKKLIPHLDKNVTTIFGVEHALYSPGLNTAGRTDLIARWAGIPSIIDFKSAKKKKREEDILSYFVQATTYATMFNESYGEEIKQIVVMITVDHDEPQIFVRSTAPYLDLMHKIFPHDAC